MNHNLSCTFLTQESLNLISSPSFLKEKKEALPRRKKWKRERKNDLPLDVVEKKSPLVRQFLKQNQVSIDNVYKFFNFNKFLLIQWYSGNQSRIMDLGCGKGSDMAKYKIVNPECVFFVDKNENDISEAKFRFETFCKDSNLLYPVQFFTQDFSQNNFFSESKIEISSYPRRTKQWTFEKFIHSNQSFVDVVYSFLSLSYVAHDLKLLNQTLLNVSRVLKEHGFFIVIILNAKKVQEWASNPSPLFSIQMLSSPPYQTGSRFSITAPFNDEAKKFYTDEDCLLYEKDLIQMAKQAKLDLVGTETISFLYERSKTNPRYLKILENCKLSNMKWNDTFKNIMDMYSCYFFVKN